MRAQIVELKKLVEQRPQPVAVAMIEQRPQVVEVDQPTTQLVA
jgi:hypothetical protein